VVNAGRDQVWTAGRAVPAAEPRWAGPDKTMEHVVIEMDPLRQNPDHAWAQFKQLTVQNGGVTDGSILMGPYGQQPYEAFVAFIPTSNADLFCAHVLQIQGARNITFRAAAHI
jgi:hypothetical protein